jgi:acyl-CoA reductase-like NAD-dependent aldehyde dehydrogenase
MNVKVGDPADASVLLGPDPRRRRAASRSIRVGQKKRNARRGRQDRHLDRGYFLKPTIFCDVRNDMRIAREEISPVQVVFSYDDIDDAVRIANDRPTGSADRS